MKRSAFEVYLRTGRRIPEPPETKFNPWHDPENGRFTFAGQGRHYGGGHTQSNDRGFRAASPKPAQSGPKRAPRANQDSATYVSNLREAANRMRREMRGMRKSPAITSALAQRLKRNMIPEENDRNDVYLDSRGVPTVGIGHKVVSGDKLKVGDRISDARKEEFWRQDSQKSLIAAQEQMQAAGISDPDFVLALASVNFQLGPEWYKEHKRTWAWILKGD